MHNVFKNGCSMAFILTQKSMTEHKTVVQSESVAALVAFPQASSGKMTRLSPDDLRVLS